MQKFLVVTLSLMFALHAREPATSLADIKRSIDKLEAKIQQMDNKIQLQTSSPTQPANSSTLQNSDYRLMHILVLSLLGVIIALLIAILLTVLKQRNRNGVSLTENSDLKPPVRTKRKAKADPI